MDNPVILCVDDEPINLAILKHVLKRKFEVITCKSGPDALEAMATHQFTDVISDFHMPEMNGIEFIQKARENFPNVNYHILSGYHDNKEITKALKKNIIKNYFEKPFNKKEIIRAVSSDN